MSAQGTPATLTLDPDTVATKHARALAGIVEGDVRFTKHDRMLYATDASIYQVEPLGVVIPKTTEDVRQVIAYCAQHNLPVLPRGGGTSLAGQCVNRAVVIDTSVHLTRLLDVDAGARTCRVQAGITIADLNAQLETHGLHFAPDPSTIRQANIGGCIGNNAAGTRSVLYGRMSENIISVAGFLPSGEAFDSAPGVHTEMRATLGDLVKRHAQGIRERFPKTSRRNAGYALDMLLDQIEAGTDASALDLAPLICGSEGTLVFVTEAVLKLHPIPKATGLAVIGFGSLDEAVAAVVPILGTVPSAVELLDDLLISLARKNAEYAPSAVRMPRPAGGVLNAVLYVEYLSEKGAGEIAHKIKELGALVTELFPDAGFSAHTDAREIHEALELRRAGEPLLHAIPGVGGRKPLGFIEDNAVPPERLGEFVTRLRAIIESHGTRAAFWAHASVGVLHVRPLLDLADDDDTRKMEAIAIETADLARELGGVMSGEHGDGKSRGPLIERHFGTELTAAFREIKELFDQKHLFNPGNIVPLPGEAAPLIETIHQRTRKRPGETKLLSAALDTYYNYEAEGGYHHAMELCNGAGVCRKSKQAAAGAMCPSYMATRDERHCTRGRANALRLAITGQLDGTAPEFNDEQTLETLDLCLSCKACKSECPSSVDVARYKAEYLAQSRTRGLRAGAEDFLLTNIRTISRLGSLTAPLANAINSLPPVGWAIRKMLGYASERSLPAFSRSLMSRTKGRSINAGLPADAPEVLVFGDCFTSFNEPTIGMDAVRVLNAFGYRARVLDVGCCARTMISGGLLAEAMAAIAKTVRAIEGDASSAAVIVLEPSCLSAIKDDWLALNLPDNLSAAARAFADRCTMLEQFLDARWDEHPAKPVFRKPSGRVALHPHCHQRALWGAGSSAAIINRVIGEHGDSVEELDTTCCGLAGAFGFAAHRYELSMRIGELSVFPAARALASDDTLLATGTSCRHQICDGTGRESVHPASFLASLVGSV